MSPEENNKYLELERNPKSLGVITTTFYENWYPGSLLSINDTDKIRGDLAIESIKRARDLGHRVVVVDGTGEESGFRQTVAELEIDLYPQREKGMDPARQEGFIHLGKDEEVQVIAWTEPEKIDMVTRECLWKVALPVLSGTYDLVIPRRDKKGLDSIPKYQKASEIRANKRFNSILRIAGIYPENALDLDIFFGPRIFNKKLLPYFTKKYEFIYPDHPQLDSTAAFFAHVKPGNYNSATFLPIVHILYDSRSAQLLGKDGLKVGNIEVPYIHPEIQTKNETDNPKMVEKRWDQYLNINLASLHYVLYLLEKDNEISRNRNRSRIRSL